MITAEDVGQNLGQRAPQFPAKSFIVQGADGKLIEVKPGSYYRNTKARAERLAINGLSKEARQVYAVVELATMGYSRERAVVTMAGNRERPLTLGDIARKTRLDLRQVRRAFSTELEPGGLAERRSDDDAGLRKGHIEIISGAYPKALPVDKEHSVQRAAVIPEWVPESWTPLRTLARRLKMEFLPNADEGARSLFLARGAETARNLENAEKEARALLDLVCAQSSIRKERETTTEIDKRAAAAAFSGQAGTPEKQSPPPPLPVPVETLAKPIRSEPQPVPAESEPVPLEAPNETLTVLVCIREFATAKPADARALIAKCRNLAPEAPVDSICHFIRAKGRAAQNGRNPMGLLLTTVPPFFEGADWRVALATPARDVIAAGAGGGEEKESELLKAARKRFGDV